MVTEDNDHNHTEEEASPIDEKDAGGLLVSELYVNIEDIFDVIKNGYVHVKLARDWWKYCNFLCI